MNYDDMLRYVREAVETLASDESDRHAVAGALQVIRFVVEGRQMPRSEVLKEFEKAGIADLALTISWLVED